MRVVSGTHLLLACLALLPGLLASARGDDERDAAVARARAELARTLNTDPEGFELESIEPIGRPATGLRCGPPTPAGQGTPAWRVQFRRSERPFDVRVAGEETAICLFGGATPPVPSVEPEPTEGRVEGGLEEQTERAVADLARRLTVVSTEIEVLEAISVVWADASGGCPRPKRSYAQVLTPGARIRLKARNRVFQYHARGATGVPFLCQTPSPVEPTRVETE